MYKFNLRLDQMNSRIVNLRIVNSRIVSLYIRGSLVNLFHSSRKIIWYHTSEIFHIWRYSPVIMLLDLMKGCRIPTSRSTKLLFFYTFQHPLFMDKAYTCCVSDSRTQTLRYDRWIPRCHFTAVVRCDVTLTSPCICVTPPTLNWDHRMALTRGRMVLMRVGMVL